MATAPREERRFSDLDRGERIGRFNRIKEHATFGAFRERGEYPPLGGVLYFTQQDLESVQVDLSGRKIVLARGPCLSPREELDDYLSMPPLAPMLLGNVLRAYGATVELRDLLMSRSQRVGAAQAAAEELISRDAWGRALEGRPSPRLRSLLDELVGYLEPKGADAVGLSMETEGDFLLALCLARELQQRFSIPTIVGGRGVQLPEPLMSKCPEAIIVHDEGEIPLLLCLDALFNDQSLAGVPSLAWVEQDTVRSTLAMIHDLDVRPTLDLSGAGLAGYRAPIDIEGTGPIVPYQYSIGCPSCCGFCNATSRRVIRLRAPDKIVADLQNAVERFDVQRFHMLSHLMNADSRHLDELLTRLEAAKLEMYWSDCCRPTGIQADTLERMRRVGASVLVWGVDCASDRLSRIMNKGVVHDRALHILAAAHRAGIRNIVNIIIGMPHETEQDLDEMRRFIDRAKPFVHRFETPTYRFDHQSLLARHPEDYGLRPGLGGGVDEPRGQTWAERRARLPALERRLRRHDPFLRGYDLRGLIARALTGPAFSPLRRRLRSVKERMALRGERAGRSSPR